MKIRRIENQVIRNYMRNNKILIRIISNGNRLHWRSMHMNNISVSLLIQLVALIIPILIVIALLCRISHSRLKASKNTFINKIIVFIIHSSRRLSISNSLDEFSMIINIYLLFFLLLSFYFIILIIFILIIFHHNLGNNALS